MQKRGLADNSAKISELGTDSLAANSKKISMLVTDNSMSNTRIMELASGQKKNIEMNENHF